MKIKFTNIESLKVLFLTMLLVLVVVITSCTPSSEKQYRVVQGIPVYDSFSAFQENLQQHNDTLYVVNFWATWCVPCVKEMPHFVKLAETYKDKKVALIFVSLDDPATIEKSLVPFINQYKMASKVVVLDDLKVNDWGGVIDEAWDGKIPITYLYQGRRNKALLRSFDSYESLEKEILLFLNQ